MRRYLLLLLACATIGCGKTGKVVEVVLPCTSFPTISPNPLPPLKKGQQIKLYASIACTPKPALRWESLNPVVVSVSPALADSTTITILNPGVGVVRVSSVADSSYRSSIAVMGLDEPTY